MIHIRHIIYFKDSSKSLIKMITLFKNILSVYSNGYRYIDNYNLNMNFY